MDINSLIANYLKNTNNTEINATQIKDTFYNLASMELKNSDSIFVYGEEATKDELIEFMSKASGKDDEQFKEDVGLLFDVLNSNSTDDVLTSEELEDFNRKMGENRGKIDGFSIWDQLLVTDVSKIESKIADYELGDLAQDIVENGELPSTEEATTPDATTPDATTPDATTPDATTPEATTPDATTPDATTPDTVSTEAKIPDDAAQNYAKELLNGIISSSPEKIREYLDLDSADLVKVLSVYSNDMGYGSITKAIEGGLSKYLTKEEREEFINTVMSACIEQAKNGNEEAIGILCNEIYSATAQTWGYTGYTVLDSFFNNADNDVITLVKDNYSKYVEGHELRDDINGEAMWFHQDNKTSYISKIDKSWQEET